jgi:hypothetical protein
MSLNLVDDVFEPVFQTLEREIAYLSDWTPERSGLQRGLEDRWFQGIIVTPTLKARGYQVTEKVRGDGPDQRGKVDLRVRRGNAEVEIELKAANDCRVRYMVGIEKDGWLTKYVEQERRPQFAGCLFLGCAVDQEKFFTKLADTLKNPNEMRGHKIELAQSRTIPASNGSQWVLGLLVTPYGRTFVSSLEKY